MEILRLFDLSKMIVYVPGFDLCRLPALVSESLIHEGLIILMVGRGLAGAVWVLKLSPNIRVKDIIDFVFLCGLFLSDFFQ